MWLFKRIRKNLSHITQSGCQVFHFLKTFLQCVPLDPLTCMDMFSFWWGGEFLGFFFASSEKLVPVMEWHHGPK